jgi:hypothetical protein
VAGATGERPALDEKQRLGGATELATRRARHALGVPVPLRVVGRRREGGIAVLQQDDLRDIAVV